jgi:hypothetical protein
MRIPADFWLPAAARLFWLLVGLMVGALAVALLPEIGWAIRTVVLAVWQGIGTLAGNA